MNLGKRKINFKFSVSVVFITLFCFFSTVSCSNNSTITVPDNDEDDHLFTDDDHGGDLDIEYYDDKDVSDIDDDHFIDDDPFADDDENMADLVFRSGFVELEPVSYKFGSSSFTTGKVRMWYNFQPADEDPEKKPLFVFFNGGPGASSTILFTYNTSKMTGDQAFSQEDIIDNPYSWTAFGNLLYIDARQTGYSYGLIDNPESGVARSEQFSPANFNVFIDAADFIRVILRILDRKPDIRSNEVVLVGQSYGGTRVTAMLNILLNVRDYSEGNRFFYDEKLFDEISSHYRKIYPEIDSVPDKEKVKKQFLRQIHIQPLVAGHYQFEQSGLILEKAPGPMYEIEAETGIKFNPCNPYNSQCRPHNNALNYVRMAERDIYRYRKGSNWLFEYVETAGKKITDIELMTKLMKNDPREVSWMYAENREKAYRYPMTYLTHSVFSGNFDLSHIPDSIKTEMEYNEQYIKPLSSKSLEEVFGELSSYDEYYIGLNSHVTNTFYYSDFTPYSIGNGEMFLENIRDVETFITNAEEDIVIYSPGIPPSLLEYDAVSNVIEKNGKFTVEFKDGEEITVTFPFYPESSHSVSINQPEKFYNDVKKWLEDKNN